MNLNPNHYSRWKIEPIEFIRANELDALRANIIKYIMRFDAKEGLKDLRKAQKYLEWLIEDNYGEDIEPVPTPFLMKVTYPVERPCDTEEGLIAAERALYECEQDTGSF